MQDAWQQRRGALNHDWLKNEYLKAVDGFLARLGQQSPDLQRVQEFLSVDFPEWGRRRQDLVSLLADAEEALSPRRLFDVPPLSGADPETLQWLPALIHALWVTLHPVRQWIEEAEKAMGVTDMVYRRLAQESRECLNEQNLHQLLQAKPAFTEFANSLRVLSGAISAFPHRILVV